VARSCCCALSIAVSTWTRSSRCWAGVEVHST
jgi:hypothetical protein